MKNMPIIFAVTAALLLSSSAKSDVPLLLPVQGKLVDPVSGAAKEGKVKMVFSIYNSKEGSAASPLWSESLANVSLDAGFFIVYLGEKTSFDAELFSDNAQLWLGIKVEEDEEMPRVLLGSVPYAVDAHVCEQVGSLSESDINSGFISSTSPVSGISSSDITHWNSAYSWGNHAGKYALASHTHVLSGHKSTHEKGGTDEINVTGLSGVLAEPQKPQSHSHSEYNKTHVYSAIVKGADGTVSGNEITFSMPSDFSSCTKVSAIATGYRFDSFGGAILGTVIIETTVNTSAHTVTFKVWDNEGKSYGSGSSWAGDYDVKINYMLVGTE